MKKALLLGGIVVVALAAAGVVYGPRLYHQVLAPSTPFGSITKVETVESLPGAENEPPLQAPAGQRLWLVHFQPPPEEEGKASATPQPQPEDARLIDTTGEKHTPIKMMGQIKMKEDPPARLGRGHALGLVSLPADRNRNPSRWARTVVVSPEKQI
jgi:hypothetical protein